MSNGVEVFGRAAVSNPKALLPGGFKAGIVTFTFGAQSIDRLEEQGVSVQGESKRIRQRNVFGTAGALALVKSRIVTRTIMQMRGTFKGTAKLLPCAAMLPANTITMHSETRVTNGITNRQFHGVFGITLIDGDETFSSIKVMDGVMDLFTVIGFVRQKRALADRQKRIGSAKNIESNGTVRDICSGGNLKDR